MGEGDTMYMCMHEYVHTYICTCVCMHVRIFTLYRYVLSSRVPCHKKNTAHVGMVITCGTAHWERNAVVDVTMATACDTT